MEIENFLCMVKNDFSLCSLNIFRIELNQFARYFEGRSLKELRASDLEEYRQSMFRRGVKPVSVKTKLSRLRVFERIMDYHWGYDWKRYMPRGNYFQGSVQRRDILSDEELQSLIDAAGNARDKALIAVLANTGARIDEVLNLKVGDLELGDEVVVKFQLANTRTKDHSKEVILTFGAPFLRSYLDSVHFSPESFLFPISKSPVWRMLKRTAKQAGIGKNVSAHTFRHTRATYLARLPLSGQVVKSVMGWRKLWMWDVYSQIRKDEAARQVRDVEGGRKVEAQRLVELKTNLERKAVEAVVERERQARVLSELQSRLTNIESLLGSPELVSIREKVKKEL